MESGRVLCLVSVLMLSAVGVRGLSCVGEERAYPPNHCLTFSENRMSHSEASTSCPFGLVTTVDSEQYNTLIRYTEILQQSRTLYWTGYRYNASDILVGPDDMVPASEVLKPQNYANNQPPAGDGLCVAIGQEAMNEVKLFRVNCNELNRYICLDVVTAPTITLSASASRFLSQGSSINLTCSTNSVNPVRWRRDNEVVTTDTPRLTIDSSAGILTVESLDGMKASYECMASNRAGGVVSQAIVLLDSPGGISEAPTITELSANSTSVQFGTTVSLTCSFTTTNSLERVEWFVNGTLYRTIPLNEIDTQNVLIVDSFSVDGIYQCRVFNQNGDNSVKEIFISGRAGTPGLVEFPISLPDTQTQVFISWLYPSEHNVLDPLLLRYDLYYQPGTSFDERTARNMTNISPLLLSGKVSSIGVVETILTNLAPGTTYIVTIRASSSAASGELRGGRVIVTTYGNVPTVSVNTLKAARTRDNKTLFADWENVETIPPIGGVAHYWVDYRDSNKDDAINSVILEPKYSYLVVSPVEDAQNYQVRVRVGVITRREPLTYSYSPYTKWVEARGIVATVPPAPPTEPLRPAAGVIAAAVVVPVFVIALILAILGVGIVFYCLKRFGARGSYSIKLLERKDSQKVDIEPTESTSEQPEKQLGSDV